MVGLVSDNNESASRKDQKVKPQAEWCADHNVVLNTEKIQDNQR